MGTNYYWHKEAPCPTCGRSDDPIHIGKSSAGWCFSLHVYPDGEYQPTDRPINDLPDWEKLFRLPGSHIEDEYGDSVSVEEMLEEITDRHCKGARKWTQEEYDENNAIPGPLGLVRVRVGGRWDHCIRNGAGTWDCIIGDFS